MQICSEQEPEEEKMGSHLRKCAKKQGKRKEYPIATVDCWIRSQWLSVMDVSYDEHCVKQACIMETSVHIVTTVTGFTSTIGMSFCGLLDRKLL